MKKAVLQNHFIEHYKKVKTQIRKRLDEFSDVKEEDYFYELCFCILTPQSRAKNALQVIEKLKLKNFQIKPFNPVDILNDKEHYIRFHNTKAQRLIEAVDIYPDIINILKSKNNPAEKRLLITSTINGYGLKESSHFMRNIGHRDLAILDRHILRCLTECKVFDEMPKISSAKQYLFIENEFSMFSKKTNIPMDELDLLFWSYATGEIIK